MHFTVAALLMPMQQVESLVLLCFALATLSPGHWRTAAWGLSAEGAGARPLEQRRYKKIQPLSISFPIKYSLPRASQGAETSSGSVSMPQHQRSFTGAFWLMYTGLELQCPAKGQLLAMARRTQGTKHHAG